MMRSFAALKYGSPASHTIEQIEQAIPSNPKGRDVVIKIKAAATNPVDVKKLKNFGNLEAKIEKENPVIVGFDGSGIVQAVGDEVKSFKAGDEVYFPAILGRPGTLADYTVVDERMVGKKPKSLSWEEAATIPLCVLTAWEGLTDKLGLSIPKDEAERQARAKLVLLVINGAGGVGSMVSQIGKLYGLTVISTASRPETIAHCKAFGADFTIDHRSPLLPQLNQLGFAGVDYIFNNFTISDNWDEVVQVSKPRAQILCIAEGKPIDPSKMARKRLTLHWELMFSRMMVNDEPEMQQKVLNQVADLIDQGKLKHTLTKTFPFTLQGVKDALDLQESGQAIGKIAISSP